MEDSDDLAQSDLSNLRSIFGLFHEIGRKSANLYLAYETSSLLTVTQRFNYLKGAQMLVNSFWHYNHLDHSKSGYDDSVSSASPDDT
jgi:hypothetical protein